VHQRIGWSWVWFVLAAICGSSCATNPIDPAPTLPPGAEVTTPFPLDRGDDGLATPGTYKGLPLRLVSRPAPAVTPVDGIIGVVCVGMSNATQECGDWIRQLEGPWGSSVHSTVRVVNCAVGGHAIERWNDPAFDAVLWNDCLESKLAAAGLRPDQVRVVYNKAANQFGSINGRQLPPMPSPDANYHLFIDNLDRFAARMPEKFPNVQAVYTTSRSYGGFAGANSPRGEPQAYEEGHALNTWLTRNETVRGIWYGWGPYIWAPACDSGITNGSGVCYEREDYQADAVHPSDRGERKIARMIHERFRRDAWYRP
jgi:hypothetical protein